MSIVESTCKANNDEANVAQDVWTCVITCKYDSIKYGSGWGFVLDFW